MSGLEWSVEATLAQLARDLTQRGVDFSTPAAAEEALRSLQAEHEGFHRLPIVQHIQSRLDTALRLQVPKRVNEEISSSGGQVDEATAANAAAKLSGQAQFQALQIRLVGEVQNCVDTLQMREKPVGSGMDFSNGSGAQVISFGDLVMDSDDSCDSGSGSEDGYPMDKMTKKALQTLQALSSSSGADVDRALDSLTSGQITADMVAESTKWEMMVDALAAAFLVRRRCVEDALLGLSEQLFKTVVDCPPQLADLFIVLATHAASIAPGLPLAGTHAEHLPAKDLRTMQLVLDMLWELPSRWTLYPPPLLQKIVNATCAMLVGYEIAPGAVEPSVSMGDEHVHAFHLLAALEPDMVWFRKWMATARVAAMLPVSMVELGAIHHMLYLCMVVLKVQAEKESAAKLPEIQPSPRGKLTPMSTVVSQAAANVLGSLISSSCGRKIFPLKVSKKLKGSMKSHKKEMNAGAIQSLVRILVPKAHPCPAPVVDAAFQQLTGLASRQSSTGSILMQQHVQGLLEPLQAVLADAGIPLPGSIRRSGGGFGGFGGYDADSVATHRMVGSVLLALAKLPHGRAVILSARCSAKPSCLPISATVVRPKEDVQGVGLSGRFGAEGKDHCLLFQLVALLAKGSLVQGAKLPLDLLAAYLDVVGEMVTDIACFWEVADCGLVDTICQALKDNSSTGRQGVKGGLDPSARSEKDKSADRARSGIVNLCAGALSRIATTPMGVQAVLKRDAVWATAAHLAKKYTAATSTPELRADMLRQASGLALVQEGREALIASGLPRMVWMELTRELLGRDDLGVLLQSDASAYPVLGSLRDMQGIMAWHGSAAALLAEPMKISSVPDSHKVLRGVVDGLTAGKDTYGSVSPEDAQQVGLQLCCMYRLDADGLALLATSTKLQEVLAQLVKSHLNDIEQAAAAALPTEKKGKGSIKSMKAKKGRRSTPTSGSAKADFPKPAPNESWVLESVVDMNTASAHALLEAQHTLGGANERSLVPYPCHIKAATWYYDHPQSLGLADVPERSPAETGAPRKVAAAGVADALIGKAPGMKMATQWWEEVQAKVIEDMCMGTLNFSHAGLLMQRTVMVAMNGKHSPEHHFSMISCSQHLAWNPISNDGSEADGDREAQPDTAMTFHPTVEKGIERAASYLSRVASGYYCGTSRKDWAAESLANLQKWAFRARKDSNPSSLPSGCQIRSTDWFVSIVWSIMGPGTTTQEFLSYLTRTPVAVYVWPAWGDTVMGSLPAMMLCHMVEVVATEQMPGMAGAFDAASVSMSHLILRWLTQEFVNYLSWEDIVRFAIMSLVMGPDYIVYFMVALLRHCESEARRHAASADLVPWIMQSQLGSFHLPEYLDYIQKLEADYKAYVLPALISKLHVQCDDLKD